LYSEKCGHIVKKKRGLPSLLNEKKLDLWLNQPTHFVSIIFPSFLPEEGWELYNSIPSNMVMLRSLYNKQAIQ
jgi:hypothetical protein